MSASELGGQGTCSDTQNTLGVVKPRDLPGLVVPGYVWSESGEHPGWFGVATPPALVPGGAASSQTGMQEPQSPDLRLPMAVRIAGTKKC